MYGTKVLMNEPDDWELDTQDEFQRVYFYMHPIGSFGHWLTASAKVQGKMGVILEQILAKITIQADRNLMHRPGSSPP